MSSGSRGSRSVLVTAATAIAVFLLSAPSAAAAEVGVAYSVTGESDFMIVSLYASPKSGDVRTVLSDEGVSVVEEYESFVIVELSSSEGDRLERRGLDVVRMRDHTVVGRGDYRFDTRAGEPNLPPRLRIDESIDRSYDKYIVQFIGPIKPTWFYDLETLGAVLHEYLPQYSMIVEMDSGIAEKVRGLREVNWVGIYQPAYKIGAGLLDSPSISVEVVLSLFSSCSASDAGALLEDIETAGGELIAAELGMDEPVIHAQVPKGIISDLARQKSVSWIGGVDKSTASNGVATWVVQTNVNDEWEVFLEGLSGSGEIISVTDSGLYVGHPMFSDTKDIGPDHRKILDYYVPMGAQGDGFDNSGHGTHVTGTAAGDAYIWHRYDPRQYDGHGFDSRVIMQDIDIDPDLVVYPPPYYQAGNLFYDAMFQGARIHTNSWGSGVNDYGDWAHEIDEFIWDYEDNLVLFSAGNAGPYIRTISATGNAKNIMTVGACYNGDDAGLPWENSSRGTAEDGRLKPTVVAPGVHIYSASAFDNGLVRKDGTSMSTPAVAGCAALVREYFADGWYPYGVRDVGASISPSAALVKAMIINSADPLESKGSLDPDATDGWGRVCLDNVMYFDGETRRTWIADERDAFTSSGQTRQYQVTVADSGEPLEVTLVWTDPEGASGANPAIVNNLDLKVYSPGGTLYRGGWRNYDDGETYANGVADTKDVEEAVLRLTPAPGVWTIQVVSTNLVQGPQSFALVATGGFPYQAIPESVVVDTPNGGEVWHRGVSNQVYWSSYGIPSTEYVKIELFREGTLVQTLSTSTLNDGVQSCYVSSSLPIDDNYHVKISWTDKPATVYDWSDSYFSLADEPSEPTSLVGVYQKSYNRVYLDWNPPLYENGCPITGYKIYRGVKVGNDIQFAYYKTVTSSSYYDYGIQAKKTYYYYVTALNDVGESAPSSTVRVKVV